MNILHFIYLFVCCNFASIIQDTYLNFKIDPVLYVTYDDYDVHAFIFSQYIWG